MYRCQNSTDIINFHTNIINWKYISKCSHSLCIYQSYHTLISEKKYNNASD